MVCVLYEGPIEHLYHGSHIRFYYYCSESERGDRKAIGLLLSSYVTSFQLLNFFGYFRLLSSYHPTVLLVSNGSYGPTILRFRPYHFLSKLSCPIPD